MVELKTLTVPHMFKNTVQKFGHRPSLSMVNGIPLTYNQVSHQVNEVMEFLADQGIVSGDKVAILSENMPQWGISYLAITCMGAVAVPILKDFHSNEIMHIIKHSNTKLVFVSNNLYDKINTDYTGSQIPLVMIENFTLIPHYIPKDKLSEFISDRTITFNKIKNKALKAIGLKRDEVKEDDLAAIIYTSGTTGQSKGVMLSHKNIVYDAYITVKNIQKVDENDRLISILPLAHTYECTIGFIIPMMCGSSVYYLDRPPTASVLVPAMQKIRPTMILTVPLVIEKIFKIQIHPQLNKNQLFKFLYKIPGTRKFLHKIAGNKLQKLFGGKIHFFGIGGAKLSYEVERFLWEAGFPYAIGYGLTETSPLVAGASPSKLKFRSTGISIPGIEVRIDQANPQTGEGEIQVKGETVMKGYYNDPERTKEVFTEDGWFKTGDLGIMKEHNYLYIKGRIKNVIIGPSGENIYPEEIESTLNQNELVLESMVYYSNDKIVARVFLNYEIIDREISMEKLGSKHAQKHIDKILEQIRIHANANISSYSRIMKVIEQKEPFVKTPTMKIKRFLYED